MQANVVCLVHMPIQKTTSITLVTVRFVIDAVSTRQPQIQHAIASPASTEVIAQRLSSSQVHLRNSMHASTTVVRTRLLAYTPMKNHSTKMSDHIGSFKLAGSSDWRH